MSETLLRVLFIFSIGLIYWLSTNVYLILGTLFLTILVWLKYHDVKEIEHFKNLAQDRLNDSICTFVRSFEYRKLDTKIIRAVYEEIQEHIPEYVQPFPVRADDHIFNDLKIDEEDFDITIIEAISIRTNRSLDNYKNNPFYGKVLTPYGLVMFFQAQPHIKTT